MEKIVKSLNLKISARDSRQSDSKAHLQAIFHQWLPLSKTVLQMVVEKLPSPLEISSERVEKLMCGGLRTFESLPDKTKSLKHGMCHIRKYTAVNSINTGTITPGKMFGYHFGTISPSYFALFRKKTVLKTGL